MDQKLEDLYMTIGSIRKRMETDSNNSQGNRAQPHERNTALELESVGNGNKYMKQEY
jgi:hypothetical protein